MTLAMAAEVDGVAGASLRASGFRDVSIVGPDGATNSVLSTGSCARFARWVAMGGVAGRMPRRLEWRAARGVLALVFLASPSSQTRSL